MNTEFKPQHLPVAAFATAGAHISGTVALSKLERLAQDLRQQDADLVQNIVQWEAQGVQRAVLGGKDQVWLHLQATAQLPLTCQRCMELVLQPVELNRSFRFVATEAQAAEQDDEAEEDLLVLQRQFDVLELLEDELLMALPMVPKHEVCPAPVKLAVADAEFEAQIDAKPKPFAALAALAKKNSA